MPYRNFSPFYDVECRSMHIDTCINQEDLNDIAMRFGSVLQVLTISHEALSGDSLLSFRNLHFPELQELTLNGPSIKAIDFTIHNTPKLRSLNVANARTMRYFKLQLPELYALSLVSVAIEDLRDVGLSLSRCPHLTWLSVIGMIGFMGRSQVMSLESCESLQFEGVEDIEDLSLYVPKLKRLNITSCPRLDGLSLLKDSLTLDQVEKIYGQDVPLLQKAYSSTDNLGHGEWKLSSPPSFKGLPRKSSSFMKAE